MARTTNIRCPVYGFVTLEDWQREIIDQAAFQRLRRIRQLGMAEFVYPSLTHTRFEHSLGTMHMATLLFDGICNRARESFMAAFGSNGEDLRRMRRLVQAAALLHDIGHGPLSHVSESLLPVDRRGASRRHETYSAGIVRHRFSDVIDNHPSNRDFGITAHEVAALLLGQDLDPARAFWRGVLTGQVDADRMDYLIRDSLHSGVAYGRYDWPRIVLTATAVEDGAGRLTIGLDERGWHAAEQMILARYSIFTQIYFHHTTAILEHDIRQVMEGMLEDGRYPGPESDSLDEYLEWDDWRVFGALAEGQGGEAGRRIRLRIPHAQAYCTVEAPGNADLEALSRVENALGPLLAARLTAERSSWYHPGADDVLIGVEGAEPRPLSSISAPVAAMLPHRQVRLYVARDSLGEAEKRMQGPRKSR